MYFTSNRPRGVGKHDIYRAQYLGDVTFDTPISIGPVVTSKLGSGDTFVSADESCLISSHGKPEADGMFLCLSKERRIANSYLSQWTYEYKMEGLLHL
ncbi:hypothetical protein [Psychroserpens burtonensis]|uniref:hypothetical protein n=1 Tax=Psychroserpens burtonensis TaxID=49278 RepID=UPI00040F6789|nr:hypothetical protein [Psychroserpens burtonensis]